MRLQVHNYDESVLTTKNGQCTLTYFEHFWLDAHTAALCCGQLNEQTGKIRTSPALWRTAARTEIEASFGTVMPMMGHIFRWCPVSACREQTWGRMKKHGGKSHDGNLTLFPKLGSKQTSLSLFEYTLWSICRRWQLTCQSAQPNQLPVCQLKEIEHANDFPRFSF